MLTSPIFLEVSTWPTRSFEAFYDLKFQLSTGRLERDYLVLCHGRMPARCLEIANQHTLQ